MDLMPAAAETVKSLLEDELLQFRNSLPKSPLYDPVRYIVDLGGKRMRPLLCLMACEMFGSNPQKAVSPAVGIELFHNFTLIHDDIMDRAPLRRGKPTVHTRWNENTGILSGDALLIKAYQQIAKVPENLLSRVISIFNQTALEVCEGQQLDMDFETRLDVSLEEYRQMIRLKTSVLLATSLKIGAMLGGASEKDQDLMYNFGIQMGMAFQIQDDLLDVFGDTSKVGKQSGGDIIAGKKTYLLIAALEACDREEHKALTQLLDLGGEDADVKVGAIMEIYNKHQIEEITQAAMLQHFNLGMQYFDQVSVGEMKKAPLRTLANTLYNRDH